MKGDFDIEKVMNILRKDYMFKASSFCYAELSQIKLASHWNIFVYVPEEIHKCVNQLFHLIDIV